VELQISHLSKTYSNGVRALKDVSLTVPAGMFGLLGPNGAGKSTLMRILATLQRADQGSAQLDGVDVLNEHDRVRRMLGYLPQEFGLYPKVSALELLDHFALLKGVGGTRARRDLVISLLKKTNLFNARHRKLGTFSGGMKQRFGIAQALIGDPRLIIVDEPTAGLDPEERVRFHNLLSEIGENIVVILSTHIVADVSDLCPNMAVLYQGEVVATGEPQVLVAALRGKVWRKFVDEGGVGAELKVLSNRRLSGRTLVHVLSDSQPDGSFEAVEPDLEDVYFAAIRGRGD
jgi:ABC-type multidrug transport system ATPase subunit